MRLKVRGGKRLPRQGIERLLIRGTNWIGDVVMTLPAVGAIRKTWPRARISVLAKPWVAELYRLCPDVDEVVPFQEPGRHAGVAGKIRLAGELRDLEFDCAILLQNAIEAAILAKMAGIPLRAGYNSDGRGWLLTHSVRRTKEIRRVHQIDYYAEMVRALGCEPSGREVCLRPGREYDDLAERLFADFGISRNRPLIGIGPGAAYGPAKRWFPDRFAAVADRLKVEFEAQVILLGSEGDRKSATEVQKNATERLVDVAGQTDLREAIALISRCSLFLSNDSGLMHIAGALGVPTIAVFGSTNPLTTSPVGEKSVVIRHPVPCAPCLKPVCPTDFRCMELIGAEEVYETAKRLLQEGRQTQKNALQTAVFIDRDGTLNEEVAYLNRLDQVRLLPGAAGAIRRINESGMKAVVITNQSGVARGFFDETFVEKTHAYLRNILRVEGATIDAFYFCPHHPTEGKGIYLQACGCRKPAPGMLLKAAEELGIDLRRSYLIGDALTDIEAGHRAGVKGILVRTGCGEESVAALAADPEPGVGATSRPLYIAADLREAVAWIMEDREEKGR